MNNKNLITEIMTLGQAKIDSPLKQKNKGKINKRIYVEISDSE